MTVVIEPLIIKPDVTNSSRDVNQPLPPMSSLIVGLNPRTESEIYKKYSAMTFKEVKEECARLHISCSGLRQDYVKKLVAYELERLVLLWRSW